MRSVRNVAFPVWFVSLLFSANSPQTPIAAVAETAAQKRSSGVAAQNAPDQAVSIQPLPVMRAYGRAAIMQDDTARPVGDNIQRSGEDDDAACLSCQGPSHFQDIGKIVYGGSVLWAYVYAASGWTAGRIESESQRHFLG